MRKQHMFLTLIHRRATLYSQEFGPPAMRQRHLPFEITPKRAQCWLQLYERSIRRSRLDQHLAEEFFYSRLEQVAAIMVNTS